MGSIAGIKTFPDHTVYCGTKFAVHAITENIREEVAGHNVRLITIAPGMVYTSCLTMDVRKRREKVGWIMLNKLVERSSQNQSPNRFFSHIRCRRRFVLERW